MTLVDGAKRIHLIQTFWWQQKFDLECGCALAKRSNILWKTQKLTSFKVFFVNCWGFYIIFERLARATARAQKSLYIWRFHNKEFLRKTSITEFKFCSQNKIEIS